MTTELAPITQPRPIVTPGAIKAPDAIQLSASIWIGLYISSKCGCVVSCVPVQRCACCEMTVIESIRTFVKFKIRV